MKWNVITGLVLLLAACAVHGPRCDGVLRPIGKPAPPSLENAADAQPR
jgi:hypothetical protein